MLCSKSSAVNGILLLSEVGSVLREIVINKRIYSPCTHCNDSFKEIISIIYLEVNMKPLLGIGYDSTVKSKELLMFLRMYNEFVWFQVLNLWIRITIIININKTINIACCKLQTKFPCKSFENENFNDFNIIKCKAECQICWSDWIFIYLYMQKMFNFFQTFRSGINFSFSFQ